MNFRYVDDGLVAPLLPLAGEGRNEGNPQFSVTTYFRLIAACSGGLFSSGLF
jgi:hypothetical protein